MYEFFTERDTTKEPQCDTEGVSRFILNHVGSCLMGLGRLREAVPFYERAIASALEVGNQNVPTGFLNLAELHAYLGELEASIEAARQSLNLAIKDGNKNAEYNSLPYLALINFLQGNPEVSKKFFEQTFDVEKELLQGVQYLTRIPGIRYAEYLIRKNELKLCRTVTKTDLQICEQNHFAFLVSQCHRVLGDLDSKSGIHKSARGHYESALKIARSISVRHVLIEALLARGRFIAKTSEVSKTSEIPQAFSDLNEALGYCLESGYRIYEADVRVALAWAYLTNGEREKAKASAERALQMSNEMGYHWGKVDAEEVLKAMSL